MLDEVFKDVNDVLPLETQAVSIKRIVKVVHEYNLIATRSGIHEPLRYSDTGRTFKERIHSLPLDDRIKLINLYHFEDNHCEESERSRFTERAKHRLLDLIFYVFLILTTGFVAMWLSSLYLGLDVPENGFLDHAFHFMTETLRLLFGG